MGSHYSFSHVLISFAADNTVKPTMSSTIKS